MLESRTHPQRSIIRNFSVTLAVALLVVAGIVLWLGYLSSSNSAVKELSSRADEQLSELQEILTGPLWNYNDRELRIIGEAYRQNESIAALTIYDAHGEILYHSGETKEMPLFSRSGQITYRGQDIGSVRFSVSGGYLEKLRLDFLWSHFTTVAMMLLATLLLAGASLHFLLKKSFANFTALVEDFSRGNEKAFAKGAAYEEFSPLVRVLQGMTATVALHNDALKETEARLNAFFNESPVGMVLYDAEGRHLKINETLTRTSGIPVEAYIGKTVHELLPKAVADEADAVRRQVMETGEAVTWELSGVLPEASADTQYLLNCFFPIFGLDGKPVAVGGSIVDISALKQSQRELQRLNAELEQRVQERTLEMAREKERAENYLKIAATMIVALDGDGNVILINDKGCEVLGYKKSELIGKNWFDTVVGDDEKDIVRETFARIMGGDPGPVEYFENNVISRDGEARLISWHNTCIQDQDGAVVGALGAGSDITEQRAVQQSLEDAFELNQAILVNSPVGIALYDGDGDCVMVNQALADTIGATTDQVLALNFHDIKTWKSTGLYEKALQALADGERVRSEVQIKTTFGRELVGDFHFSPVAVHGRTHLLLMINDVTELKRMQDQLIQSSKMATLGEMATGVAHELNQPLNVIRLAMNNIQNKSERGVADPEYLHAKLDKVVAQVERASAIIDHMRIFGRKPDTQTALLDPAEMVRSSMGLIGEQLRLSGIEVATDLEQTHGYICGHQVQVEQVLLNLLANARDEMNAKDIAEKRIVVRVGEREDGQKVCIEVEDTGGGIPADVMDRIFEPFFTTKGVGKGTGLGLSISYGIVTEMGGTLEARNAKDGACFTITLPAHQENCAA